MSPFPRRKPRPDKSKTPRTDWGGVAHVGGGSHGSLHRGDSLGVLLFCGTGPGKRESPAQWSIRDVTPMILRHFSLTS